MIEMITRMAIRTSSETIRAISGSCGAPRCGETKISSPAQAAAWILAASGSLRLRVPRWLLGQIHRFTAVARGETLPRISVDRVGNEMNGSVHHDDFNSIRMIRAGHHGGEGGHRGRPPFRLRDPVDNRGGRTLAGHRCVRWKQCRESSFMGFAIDPFAMRTVLLEIAAKAADVRGRIGHRLRWTSYRGVTEIGRVRLALGKTERLGNAVREFSRAQRL